MDINKYIASHQRITELEGELKQAREQIKHLEELAQSRLDQLKMERRVLKGEK